MEFTSLFLLSIGGIFLVGQAISTLGHRTFLPRVTLLLLFGVAIGKDGVDIIPPFFMQHFELITEMTLLMVGFLIGGKLTRDSMKTGINKILWISMSEALLTAVLVTLGLIIIGLPVAAAIIIGCIASASAPTATLDVVIENGYKTPFSNLLISIVALDDAWALMLFALGLAIAGSMNGHAAEATSVMFALKHIIGSIVLGVTLGLPAAFLTGRLKANEPILTEALGLVFICGGLAIWLEVSSLISAIVLGATIANFARHHEYAFHEIENIEWPFMVIFFVLAGATLELEVLKGIGFIGAVYVACRVLGKIIGTNLGARFSGADSNVRRWMGFALLPQAGVAIGMGLVASSSFPEYRHLILPLVISTTIVFELIGPVFTRLAITKAS